MNRILLEQMLATPYAIADRTRAKGLHRCPLGQLLNLSRCDLRWCPMLASFSIRAELCGVLDPAHHISIRTGLTAHMDGIKKPL